MMINEIVKDMMQRDEEDSWQEKIESFYRVNIMIGNTGFPRCFHVQSEEFPHGLSKEKALSMAKGKSTVHEITAKIKRIK